MVPQETGLTPKDWVDIITSIVNAMAVVLGVFLALLGLNAWRREMTGRRDADLAEAALAAFYEARDNLTWVRMGATFGDEGSSRPGRENDGDESQTRRLNAYYAPIERLKAQSNFWGKFEASRYRFQALFGDAAARPFEDIRRIRIEVIGAAEDLIEIFGPMPDKRAQEAEDETRKLRRTIWHHGKDDPLADGIASAVRAMEEFCRPIIAGQGVADASGQPLHF